MKNIIDFIKDKIYYFMGGTIIIIILLVAISSCSSGKTASSYDKIESNMVSAAKKYYDKKPDNLPKTENGTVKLTISSMVESELLDEVKDPKDKSKTCSGYVEVTKVGEDYSYTPFLTCEGNYEPEYLIDKLKNTSLDEYGNGLYEQNGEFVFKGEDVKNYVTFNNQTWKIIKIDASGNIKLVLSKYLEDTYSWDDSYNPETESNDGVTNDYLHSDIRKTLDNYYETNFDKDSKAKIVSINLCLGTYLLSDEFSVDKECSVIKENEKVVLLNATDYKNASLDTACSYVNSKECQNRNYLANSNSINTWLSNPSSEKSNKVLYVSRTISQSNASNEKRINPVIYITSKSITSDGNGTLDKPYIIK